MIYQAQNNARELVSKLIKEAEKRLKMILIKLSKKGN